jgi:hypothetical protein
MAFVQGCSSGSEGSQSQQPVDGSTADGAESADGGEVDAPVDGGADVLVRPSTFSGVYQQVLAPNCALPFCHAGTGDYLELADMDIGYASLVNAPAQGPGCAETGLKRVDPFHPETSLLYLKVTNPPCGDKMPRSYGSAMSLDQPSIDQIKAWITLGAKND